MIQDEPVFQALLLAEFCWHSPQTGQASISNVMDSILLHPDHPVDKPPPLTKAFFVFAKIANLKIQDIVKIRIYSSDLSHSEDIGSFQVSEEPIPHRGTEFMTGIKEIQLPKCGLYHIELTARNNNASVPLFVGPYEKKPDEE